MKKKEKEKNHDAELRSVRNRFLLFLPVSIWASVSLIRHQFHDTVVQTSGRFGDGGASAAVFLFMPLAASICLALEGIRVSRICYEEQRRRHITGDSDESENEKPSAKDHAAAKRRKRRR